MLDFSRILANRGRWWLPAAAVTLMLAAAAPAASADDQRGCRASAVRLDDRGTFGAPVFEPIVANRAITPCADDEHSALTSAGRVGTVRVVTGALNAFTDDAPLRAETGFVENASEFTLWHARSEVASVTITSGLNKIVARGLKASLVCRYSPFISGFYLAPETSVADVTVNGRRVNGATGGPSYEIPGLGTLHINWIGFQETGNTFVSGARALWLDGITEVVVAEATMYTDAAFPTMCP